MEKPLTHLCFVVHSLNPGGAERLAVEMSIELSQDYRITVVCLDEPGKWAQSLREEGIPVLCLWRQPGFDRAAAVDLSRICREANVDVIHAHQSTPWFYAALAKRRYGKPRLLFEEHGRFFPEEDKWLRRLVNRLIIRKVTDRVVAVSEDIRDRLIRYEGLEHDDIEVVYNGVRIDVAPQPEMRARVRAEFGFSADEFVVGSVGRLDEIKNYPMLVESLALAHGEVAGVRGLIVGSGPDSGRIAKAIEKAGASNVVKMAGHREDARLILRSLDLFVLSSLSEGTSMALLEAMALGVPAVVTDVGGNPEVVIDGKTGWVVPSRDVGSLSAAIVAAAKDSAAAQQVGAAGRDRFVEKFAFSRMMRRYREIYSELRPRSESRA